MNIPKEAIEKAISGGWSTVSPDRCKFQEWGYSWITVTGEKREKSYAEIAFDSSFWQCLGKALGWEKKMVVRRAMVIGNFGWENPDKSIRFYGEEMGAGMDYMNPWLYYAHGFYDLILTNQPTEKFWKELLKKTI